MGFVLNHVKQLFLIRFQLPPPSGILPPNGSKSTTQFLQRAPACCSRLVFILLFSSILSSRDERMAAIFCWVGRGGRLIENFERVSIVKAFELNQYTLNLSDFCIIGFKPIV